MPADQTRHRRQVDDGAALFAQERERIFAAEKGAVEIDAEHAPPGGEVELLDAAEGDNTGGIHQPVEPAMLALDLGGDALPVGFRGDVERRIDAGAAGQIGGNRHTAGAVDRGGDGCADGARGARH